MVFLAYILPAHAEQGKDARAEHGLVEELLTIWYSPVNGRGIAMPQGGYYRVVKPGLSWDFYQGGIKKFNFSFKARVRGRISFVRRASDYEETSRSFKLCGQHATHYLTYRTSDPVQKNVSLRFHTGSLARTPHSPFLFKYALDLDFSFAEDALNPREYDTLFCSFVDNFQHIADEMILEEGNVWRNPLSERPFRFPSGWHAYYVDITVSPSGEMQIYRLSNNAHHIMLYKLPFKDFLSDKEREFLDKRDLPEGAIVQGGGFHDGDVKGEFVVVPNAGGKDVTGLLLGKKSHDDQIYVKIWSPEGLEIGDRERDLVTRLIENSLPDD